ncbi:MAG: excinuclease ABC subunit A, partial [Spirochaetaceae bacterium]
MKRKPEPGSSAVDDIAVWGACQNNLKDIDIRLPLRSLIVLTGVSGSGKSSLAFDTLYAEGQRRYVETFSAYTRQFLDRMDKPRVERIDGIPPAIAVDQTNPVRTSRSTVGTMSELNDHLKLLFARVAQLHCRACGRPVTRDTAQSATETVFAGCRSGTRLVVTFPVPVPHGFSEDEIVALLEEQGYLTIHARSNAILEVAQDRTTVTRSNRQRIVEACEAALQRGHGRVAIWPVSTANAETRSDSEACSETGPYRFSSDLHCARCDIHYRDPVPNLFSFNSPLGACPECRGFGRVIDIDLNLIVPDETRTLAGGAVKPWQSGSYRECQRDLESFARRRSIPLDVPWRDLSAEQRSWVVDGEGDWDDGLWYGVRRFFTWLESKSYRMHIRVLLSRYRAYTLCSSCGGARLKPEALDYRLDGLSIHDLMQLPIKGVARFFENLRLDGALDEATALLLREIRARLRYLVDVGVGYLALDRQSRTLSGGEVQRINLTTALGTSLVNTLFVLDEPSIGLHQRDIGRLIDILTRLRDMGNTIVVVEHDPEVIRAADMVIDMGPRAGEHGGEVIFQGTVPRLLGASGSLTADYLTGRKRVAPRGDGTEGRAVHAGGSADVITIQGAAEHNLKQIDVELPLRRLVAITGVSGSGKSTLVQDVLYNAARAAMGRPVEAPGRHRAIHGLELIDDVVLVDQSSIGKTTRSNPASYVGAFDAVRSLFAAQAISVERGYSAGTFSFNLGNGRCPTCAGNGFEHIEMQFLSDVYVRCPDCNGTRFRPEILDVRLAATPSAGGSARAALSIADVLEMTVDAACAFFADQPKVVRAMEPLRDVGLGYLRLGQPVPTLSGGEAQRLKLAGYLAESRTRKGRTSHLLFLFDEPTTGLHFDDIEVLLRALRALITAGHSVVVIEHNLDVVSAADWVVDLGPSGGDAGGSVVATGTPDQLIAGGQGHTATALQAHAAHVKEGCRPATDDPAGATVRAVADTAAERPLGACRHGRYTARRDIEIRNAREHNLKGIDLRIPPGSMTVLTGVSGSGKSTVAFDILFAEGQRRYLESLNAYARQFVQPAARADFDAVVAVPPAVAIEQRTSRGGYRSTVATATEVYHFLRLLYVKLGVQYCPDCDLPISPQNQNEIASQIMRDCRGRKVEVLAPLVVARKGYYTDLAKWAAKKGYVELRVD